MSANADSIEQSVIRMEQKMGFMEAKMEQKMDKVVDEAKASKKWVISLCFATILGIAAMVVTVIIT